MSLSYSKLSNGPHFTRRTTVLIRVFHALSPYDPSTFLLPTNPPSLLLTPTLTSFLLTNSPGVFPPEGLNTGRSLYLKSLSWDAEMLMWLLFSLPSCLDSIATFSARPLLITWFKSRRVLVRFVSAEPWWEFLYYTIFCSWEFLTNLPHTLVSMYANVFKWNHFYSIRGGDRLNESVFVVLGSELMKHQKRLNLSDFNWFLYRAF